MATLRCSSLFFRCGLVVTATIVTGGAVRAVEPAPPTSPAKLRLPGWIQAIGGSDAKTVRDPAVAPTAAHAPSSGSRAAAPRRSLDRTSGGEPVLPAWISERLSSPFRSRAAAAPAASPIRAAVPGGQAADQTANVVVAAVAAESPADTSTDQATPAAPPTSAESSATAPAPLASAEGDLPTLAIDAASFRGVLPGKSTRAEVEADWGPGEQLEFEGNDTMTWAIEPFERVELSFDADVVTAIRIKLADPLPVTDLARQLEIADLRTVTIFDEDGVAVGEVYPERGVILSLKPETRTVNAIMIEPLDPDAFVLRAEGEMESSLASAVTDLVYAISIDPDHARANRLLMVLKAEAGQRSEALRLAETATRVDPEDVWTQLKQAGLLVAVEMPHEARDVLGGIRDREGQPPLVVAQVERLLGRAALVDAEPDHQAAVEHFAESIRRATPLVGKPPAVVQAAAAEILLDAHLGTALAIAAGTWQEKSRVLPKWVSRAETIVNDFRGGDTERAFLELRLCQGVLAAAAGSEEAIEPMPWVKRLLATHERISSQLTDPWRRRQLDWEVGQGLNDALVAAQKRGELEDMLDNATLTAAYLERGAVDRDLSPTELREYGDLLFRIGILHSLQRGDHATAVTWFDKTLPLWQQAGEQIGDIGRVGEACVSMAISYWQVDRREDALSLSRRGVELMVDAVDEELLEERALAIAYGNLATMYAEEGDDQQAQAYAEMAGRVEATAAVIR